MNRRKFIVLSLWAVGIVAIAWGFRLRATSAHTRLDLLAAQKAHDRDSGETERLEKRNRVVADHIAELRAKPETQAAPTTRTAQELLAQTLQGKEKYRALLDDSRMRELSNASRRAAVRTYYRELYHQLRLSPNQTAALEALLTEGRERQEDIRAAADFLNEPMSSPDMRSLLDDEKRAWESQAQALLGSEAFRKLQTFQETAGGRELVNDVTEALTFSAAPLKADQKTKLLDLLKTYRINRDGDDALAPVFDWDELQAQAATFLTPPQRAELNSSIADAQYWRLTREYGKMLQDWVQQNAPKDR